MIWDCTIWNKGYFQHRCFMNMEYSAHMFKGKRFQSGSHIEAVGHYLPCNHLLKKVRLKG
ncbi:hypothetical protein HanXRQr2_Chr01g0028771 [Helianthus annuus]|uniref:Uncharacterized protein n=1 Tax=Helianthus annuus TaxID=4232 RepID=A0A9K3JVT0_HELAN|nr:hypothetical protein HanXRQr2_Chr01g0028771 [Helianthus annuus]KAJ0957481.1 hypothetical protein HanPSC8_Chr01g0027761 [Helianthus annuus]